MLAAYLSLIEFRVTS